MRRFAFAATSTALLLLTAATGLRAAPPDWSLFQDGIAHYRDRYYYTFTLNEGTLKHAYMIRFSKDGSIDTTFGINGVVMLTLRDRQMSMSSEKVAFDSHGNIFWVVETSLARESYKPTAKEKARNGRWHQLEIEITAIEQRIRDERQQKNDQQRLRQILDEMTALQDAEEDEFEAEGGGPLPVLNQPVVTMLAKLKPNGILDDTFGEHGGVNISQIREHDDTYLQQLYISDDDLIFIGVNRIPGNEWMNPREGAIYQVRENGSIAEVHSFPLYKNKYRFNLSTEGLAYLNGQLLTLLEFGKADDEETIVRSGVRLDVVYPAIGGNRSLNKPLLKKSISTPPDITRPRGEDPEFNIFSTVSKDGEFVYMATQLREKIGLIVYDSELGIRVARRNLAKAGFASIESIAYREDALVVSGYSANNSTAHRVVKFTPDLDRKIFVGELPNIYVDNRKEPWSFANCAGRIQELIVVSRGGL